MSAHTHGCCADKACSDKTCMELPAGKTCGDCANFNHCEAFYAHKQVDSYCDFFPRRFRERSAIAKATVPPHCASCDGTGDVHNLDGEWRGRCDCVATASAQGGPNG